MLYVVLTVAYVSAVEWINVETSGERGVKEHLKGAGRLLKERLAEGYTDGTGNELT